MQGGTFHNKAVLRAFEEIAGAEVICPDISGVMGAFGAALIARRNYAGAPTPTKMLSLEQIEALTYSSFTRRFGGCANHCMLTVNVFDGERRHITGNRCEKMVGNAERKKAAPNMVEFKRRCIFGYEPLAESAAARGTIGIPRVLNLYEN